MDMAVIEISIVLGYYSEALIQENCGFRVCGINHNKKKKNLKGMLVRKGNLQKKMESSV